MLIVGFGIVTWLIHAVRLCVGATSRWWMALWLVGLPVACLIDYLMLLRMPLPGGGIAEGDPHQGQLVLDLFLGLGLWLVLLLVEPLLRLVNVVVRRLRRSAVLRAQVDDRDPTGPDQGQRIAPGP